MSSPAPSPVLRVAEMARSLSALALWFATLLARILPGSARRQLEAEAWRYINTTMAQFADLLERLAAGEIPTPELPPAPIASPVRAKPRARTNSPRSSRSTPRTRATAPARRLPHRAGRPAVHPIPSRIARPSAPRHGQPHPQPVKKWTLAPTLNHVHFVPLS